MPKYMKGPSVSHTLATEPGNPSVFRDLRGVAEARVWRMMMHMPDVAWPWLSTILRPLSDRLVVEEVVGSARQAFDYVSEDKL